MWEIVNIIDNTLNDLSSALSTKCMNLYSCVKLEVENGQKAEGKEAHHQEVGNQDVVPAQSIDVRVQSLDKM